MDDLATALSRRGFDVLAPFRVSWYNEYIQKLGLATDENHVAGSAFTLAPLPNLGQDDALALIVGNSKAMWPNMLRWLKSQPDPAVVKDPVDTFSSEVISAAISSFAAATDGRPAIAHDMFWASDMSAARLVDMNRAAYVSGVCYFSDEMYLSIHPTFGTWVAFRAVVVLDVPGSQLGPGPALLPPLLTDEEKAAAKAAFAEALKASSEVDMSVEVGMPLEIAQKWAAMRDCVALGREYKYDDSQSEYHYTKNPEMLVAALAALDAES